MHDLRFFVFASALFHLLLAKSKLHFYATHSRLLRNLSYLSHLLDFHDLGFFFLQGFVDFADIFVG